MYPIYRYKSGCLTNEDAKPFQGDSETVTVSGAQYRVLEAYNLSLDSKSVFKCFFDCKDGYKSLGNLHSTESPAIETPEGIKKWFLDGVEYTKIQWLDKRKKT